MTQSFSQELDFKVRLFSASLNSARERFWGHPRVSELFSHLLFRMHCESRATVHLLGTAIDRMKEEPSESPIRDGVVTYLEQLQAEEVGHDDWLLHSLEALGFASEHILEQSPAPTTAAMVGSQYYWIYHHHPIAVLGYVKVLENEPSSLADIQAFMKSTGLPKRAFTYHLGHVELETEHNERLDRLLDTLPLTKKHKALIGANAARTLHYFAQSLDELVTLFDAGRGTDRSNGSEVSQLMF